MTSPTPDGTPTPEPATDPTQPRQLGRDASYVLGAQLVSIALGFALTAIASRNLDTADFAALSWAVTWLAWLALCGQLGLTQASTVFLAVEGDRGLPRLLRPIVGTVLVNSMVVAVLWWFVIGPLMAGASQDESLYRAVVPEIGFWVPAAALAPVIGGILRGLHRFRAGALYGEYLRRLLLVAGLSIMVVADLDRSVEALITVVVIVESIIATAVVVGIDRSSRQPADTASAPAPAVTEQGASRRSLRRRGLDFLLPTIDSPLLPQAGVWILALVRPAEEVAVLSVAIGISFIYGLPVFAGARVLGPRYARAHGRGDALSALQPIARRHALISTSFVVVVTLGFAVVGDWAVDLVFGETYVAAATIAVIFGLGATVNAATGSCAAALMNSGQERVVGLTAALSAVSYVGLGLIMADRWGVEGIASAAALIVASRNLYLAFVTRRLLGLTTWVGARSS